MNLSKDRYDLVRLNNVIGSEFSQEQNRRILSNVVATVKEGGLLVAGRMNDYSVMAVERQKLTKLASMGNGFSF